MNHPPTDPPRPPADSSRPPAEASAPPADSPHPAEPADGDVHVVTVLMRKRADEYEVTSDTLPPEAFEAVRSIVGKPWRDARYVVGYLRDIVRAHGLRGLLVRYVWVNRSAPPVRPIDVPFEPLLLDETHPSLRSVAETFALDGGAEPASYRPRRWRRMLVRLGIPLLVVVPQVINGLIQMAVRPTRTVVFTWLLVFAIFGLTYVVVRWAMSDWYIVPGGVALRRRLAGRVGESVRLYTPADSLLILRMRNMGWAAEIWPRSRPQLQLVTDLEAAVLAGAWTSRQRPPTADRLSDLG